MNEVLNKYDEIALAALRGLSLDMIAKAKSGHPGIFQPPLDRFRVSSDSPIFFSLASLYLFPIGGSMGAAPMAYVLFTKVMNYDPKSPRWVFPLLIIVFHPRSGTETASSSPTATQPPSCTSIFTSLDSMYGHFLVW